MRDILKKRKEKEIQKKKNNEIDQESDKETFFRIKEAKTKRLTKDLTVDLLEYLLLRRINRNEPRSARKNRKTGKITIIFLIIGIISILLTIYKFIGSEKSGSLTPQSPFTIYHDMSDFENINMYGKDVSIAEIVNEVKRMCNIIENNEDAVIQKVLKPTHKNFLFYGKPGTGKTLFVKKMCYILDIELKAAAKLGSLGKDEFEKMKYTLDEIKKFKGGAKLITVQPSSLIDKYVGSTERNIRKLFDAAKKEAKTHAVIIFIDEIDSFFSERSENNSEHATNTKTEFLCILDGIRTRLSEKIFLFGATNYEDKIDAAFLRRMGKPIEFPFPKAYERAKIIENFLEYNQWLDIVKLNKLVQASQGLSPNEITNAIGEVIRVNGFNVRSSYEDIETYFKKYKNIDKEKKIIPCDLSLRKKEKENLLYLPLVGTSV